MQKYPPVVPKCETTLKNLRKIQHPGRNRGEAGPTPSPVRRTLSQGGRFARLPAISGRSVLYIWDLPLTPSGFAAKESSLKKTVLLQPPPLWCLGARRGRTSHYIQLTSVSRKRQDVSRQTEHPIRSTNRGSTLLFRESATGDSNPSSRARPVCSRYTDIYSDSLTSKEQRNRWAS